MDIKETADVVYLLVSKADHFISVPTGFAPPAPLTKRKKDADKKVVFRRMLMMTPSVSEHVANKLVDHFASLAELQKALSDKKKFPRIRLDDRKSIGKDRVKKLAEYLL